jgi:hypothetical protein
VDIVKKLAILLALTAGICILYLVNPEHSLWLPKCYFYKLTGLECPACGTQRAIHQLLHLNIAAALGYNPFVMVSFPYLASLVAVQWFDAGNKLQKLRTFCFHHTTVNVYLLLVVLWWVIRNII